MRGDCGRRSSFFADRATDSQHDHYQVGRHRRTMPADLVMVVLCVGEADTNSLLGPTGCRVQLKARLVHSLFHCRAVPRCAVCQVRVRHPELLSLFGRHADSKGKQAKLKSPTQLQELLDISRSILQVGWRVFDSYEVGVGAVGGAFPDPDWAVFRPQPPPTLGRP